MHYFREGRTPLSPRICMPAAVRRWSWRAARLGDGGAPFSGPLPSADAHNWIRSSSWPFNAGRTNGPRRATGEVWLGPPVSLLLNERHLNQCILQVKRTIISRIHILWHPTYMTLFTQNVFSGHPACKRQKWLSFRCVFASAPASSLVRQFLRAALRARSCLLSRGEWLRLAAAPLANEPQPPGEDALH
jgi:hypothetical protein